MLTSVSSLISEVDYALWLSDLYTFSLFTLWAVFLNNILYLLGELTLFSVIYCSIFFFLAMSQLAKLGRPELQPVPQE